MIAPAQEHTYQHTQFTLNKCQAYTPIGTLAAADVSSSMQLMSEDASDMVPSMHLYCDQESMQTSCSSCAPDPTVLVRLN